MINSSVSHPAKLTRFESLHNHTRASDGPYTYLELFQAAQQYHYGVMALTDHDTVVNAKDLEILREYAGPVKWISGVEITSGLPTELGGGPTSMFHVLGLFIDPTNQALVDHCRTAVEARRERMQRIVKNLRAIGFDITESDCMAESDGETVGRRNIANALKRSPRYEQVMDRIKAQMADEAKEDPEVAMQYLRLFDTPKNDHPFQLFLSEDSYLGGIYVDYLYNIDMDTSAKLIREAGGIAVLGHWSTVSKKIDQGMIEQMLVDKRFDGIELEWKVFDDTSGMSRKILPGVVERTGTATTIGLDAHNLIDIDKFTRDEEFSQASVGQTQTLIDRFKPDLTFTNLG